MINLDSMTDDELYQEMTSQRLKTRQFAREIFPDRPSGYCRTASDLYNYVCNIWTARQCRKAGNVDRALEYERIADKIYDTLPEYAKW